VLLPPDPPVEFRTSALIADLSEVPLGARSTYRLTRMPVQTGVDVLVQHGRLDESLTLRVHNDEGRIQFSLPLHGHAWCRSLESVRPIRHQTGQHACTIEHAPERRWDLGFSQGEHQSVKIMLAPEVFAHWCADADLALREGVHAGRCFAVQRSDAHMRMLAQQLARTLTDETAPRHRLWLESQAMALVALFMQQRLGRDEARLPPAEQRALAKARDLLLADLGHAPTIAQLAQMSGMSVLKLKRGFRQQYGAGVYGVFLRERMHEARRQLLIGDASVMQIAARLGYTNASHFAAAFKRQFGVNPGEVGGR